jgi:hypothetical protein
MSDASCNCHCTCCQSSEHPVKMGGRWPIERVSEIEKVSGQKAYHATAWVSMPLKIFAKTKREVADALSKAQLKTPKAWVYTQQANKGPDGTGWRHVDLDRTRW